MRAPANAAAVSRPTHQGYGFDERKVSAVTGQERDVGPTSLSNRASDTVDDQIDEASDDEAWFRELFDASYTPLVAYARRRVLDLGEADDVVSEAFAIAWRRRHERDRSVSALPWLYGIASNVTRNQTRSRGRQLRLVERLGAQPRPAGVGDPAERPGADLRQALGGLSFDDQELLRLVAWEGLTHAEVGTALGISTNAVGIRMHRARERLRQRLDAGADTDAGPTEATEPTNRPDDTSEEGMT